MASAHIVLGKVKSGQPILDSNFLSQTIASGSTTSLFENQGNYNIMSVTAIGGNLYASFGDSPDVSTDPKVLLIEGVTQFFSISPTTLVDVVNA